MSELMEEAKRKPTEIERILTFEIDDADSDMPFSSRLAREQEWTHAYAARVIAEYKRFVVLALDAGHPVTPSGDVDQVWHLHLVYTRSYWHDFCRDTLKCDLHHGPSKGGAHEGEKFHDWYSKTLESYTQMFGGPPPEDIWPAPSKRFAHAGDGRWVDISSHFIIPIPRWGKLSFWRRKLKI